MELGMGILQLEAILPLYFLNRYDRLYNSYFCIVKSCE
jgi:hypothetical protein